MQRLLNTRRSSASNRRSNTMPDLTFIDAMRAARTEGRLQVPEGESILFPVEPYENKHVFIAINSIIKLDHNIKRTIDPPMAFETSPLPEVVLDSFMPRFLYFETITLHLLSLMEARDIHQYFRLQSTYKGVSLKTRVDLIRSATKEQKINNVGKITALAEIRNQIAHNLSPVIIQYPKKSFMQYDDSDFAKKVTNDLNEAMDGLMQLYARIIPKLILWCEPYLNKRYSSRSSE